MVTIVLLEHAIWLLHNNDNNDGCSIHDRFGVAIAILGCSQY